MSHLLSSNEHKKNRSITCQESVTAPSDIVRFSFQKPKKGAGFTVTSESG
jgi:hypothetical protein